MTKIGDSLPLGGCNGAATHYRAAFRSPDDAQDGQVALGLRAVCQNVDKTGADPYHENDYHFHDSDFLLGLPN
ncbi:MAG: hypothetical protein AAGE59_18975 [Cyanobacteria bacterium P01_F01_bin.86]